MMLGVEKRRDEHLSRELVVSQETSPSINAKHRSVALMAVVLMVA